MNLVHNVVSYDLSYYSKLYDFTYYLVKRYGWGLFINHWWQGKERPVVMIKLSCLRQARGERVAELFLNLRLINNIACHSERSEESLKFFVALLSSGLLRMALLNALMNLVSVAGDGKTY